MAVHQDPLAQKRFVLKGWQWLLLFLALILLSTGLYFWIQSRKANQAMISEFGKYQGYSPVIYDGSKRTPEYLTMSDGTRLAYDLVIPTKKGVVADQSLPVLFKYTPYGRAWTIFDDQGKLLVGEFVDLPTQVMLRVRYLVMGKKGRILDPLFRDRWLDEVVKHGYIVVSVDRPGTGASFNSHTPPSMETGAIYENEIINWIAAQPWSDGNVGMYGDSQQAMVQLAAASTGNPHLKAILPAASQIEIYQSVEFPGGIYNKAFETLYKSTVPLLDSLITPVDSDPDGVLLSQAMEERQNTGNTETMMNTIKQSPFRDSLTKDGTNYWALIDLYPFVERINQSHTAIYMTVGWYDIFTADMFYWYGSLNVPRRLTIRPVDHSAVSANQADLNYGAEALRWFDYWLKGIDNGIMDEPPIHYYLQDGPNKGTWQTSSQWPLGNQEMTKYYFGAGKIGTVASTNNGILTLEPPTGKPAADDYTVDYTTLTGTKSRWGSVEEAHVYPDLNARDAKALTYTSAPFADGMQITGHPVVHLWLSTTAPDLDAFVYLEEVDGQGKATYITEGSLRASHRALDKAPFENFGLPWHNHLQSELLPVPAGEPFELVFDLLPTAWRFAPGKSLRVTVAFADAGNFDTPVLDPAPTLQLLRDAGHTSYVDVPVIQNP